MGLLWHVIDQSGLVALTADDVYGGALSVTSDEAERWLAAGGDPDEILGNTSNSARTRIARLSLRSIAWVEQSGWLLLKQHWLWDPIRVQFQDRDLGRTSYEYLRQTLAPRVNEEAARVSMHDLPMEPRLGFGILLSLFGVGVVISGACGEIDKWGGDRVGKIARTLGYLGQKLGVVPAITLGSVVIGAGVASLAWWFVRRPEKRYVQV